MRQYQTPRARTTSRLLASTWPRGPRPPACRWPCFSVGDLVAKKGFMALKLRLGRERLGVTPIQLGENFYRKFNIHIFLFLCNPRSATRDRRAQWVIA